MCKKNFRKSKLISAIVAIVIVAGMLAGCQKDNFDDEMIQIEITDYSFSPVRLKSGIENENSGTNKVKVRSEIINSSNPQATFFTLPSNSAVRYVVELRSVAPGTSQAHLDVGSGQTRTMFHHGPGDPQNNWNTVPLRAQPGTICRGFTVEWQFGNAEATLYRLF